MYNYKVGIVRGQSPA